MIYSQWLPDRGGYVYYETAERRGLGDDLPVPRLKDTSAIGVASTDIGRPLPLGAKIVGTGPIPRGSIVPFDRSRLSGIPSALPVAGAAVMALLGTASFIAGWFLVKKFG